MSAWTTPQSWTDKRVAELKQLWDEGLSSSQIARVLGGVTRNAVIGKATRLGLSTAARRGPPRLSLPKVYVEPPPPPEAPQPLVLENGQHVTTMTLTHRMCHFPCGDPCLPDFHYCGAPRARGRYCDFHAHRAYQPLPKRQSKKIASQGKAWGFGS